MNFYFTKLITLASEVLKLSPKWLLLPIKYLLCISLQMVDRRVRVETCADTFRIVILTRYPLLIVQESRPRSIVIIDRNNCHFSRKLNRSGARRHWRGES